MLSTDPLTLAVDDEGDIDITGGTVRFAAGAEGVAILAGARLDLRRGEFFGSRRAGLPLYEGEFCPPSEALLGQDFDDAKTRAAYAKQILGTPAVSSILALSVAFDATTRTVKATWEARAAFDDTTQPVRS